MPAVTPPAPSPATLTPGRRWAIIGALCAIYIFAYIDRINLSVALSVKDFASFFQLNDIDRGALNSAFFWTYAALQIPAGWVVDRFGAKRSLAVGFILWSIVGAGTGLSQTFAQLFVMRLFLGIGESVVTPAGMRWIRFNCPEEKRGFAIGLFMAAAKVGPAIGNFIAPWLMLAYGWRPMFVMLGLGGLVCLIPWMILVKDDDRAIEKRTTLANAAPALPFSAILRSPALWGTLVGTFAYQYFNYFCMTWMQAYLVEHLHLSQRQMSIFSGSSYAGFAAVAIAAGFAADRLIARGFDAVKVRRRFAIAGLVVASTQLVGAFTSSSSVALFFAIFSLCGLGLTTANYWALTQTLIPGAAVGRIVGIQNCAANIPGIVAPLLTGWLKQTTGGYTAPMIAASGFLLLGILSYVFVVRKEYAPALSGP